MDIIVFLFIGLLVGWHAEKIREESGFGLGGNLVVGVVGAFIGGFLFKVLGIVTTNLVVSLITAVVGAIVLLFIVSKVKKA